NRRALISIRRPEMKWRGRNFEREPNQRHDDPDGEERLKRNGAKFLPDRGQRGRSRHSVNQTDSKKCERARGAAEEKIFQAGFGNMIIATIAVAIPSAATIGHNRDARLLVSPMVKTTSAVTTTIASGAASLRSSR